ncbi:MAG TPA: AAA family ATPase [Candidatus Paceibacterota bacterium]
MTALKRLEMEGFKSFGKKVILQFNTPITGVVGPNGSGKSNIVEAFRFVFGEQSMKSMRSDAGADLLFQGAGTKATEAYVSIIFENVSIKNKALLSDISALLEGDELEIKRTITLDKGSQYFINGTNVRLKDVTALAAALSLGIGSHHIISQGEADRIMSATARERKLMIEDSLGLRIYHIKIKETEKKLDQALMNVRELAAKKQSIIPIFNDLKKQVEKIELAQSLRTELQTAASVYFSLLEKSLSEESKKNSEEYGVILQELAKVEQEKSIKEESLIAKKSSMTKRVTNVELEESIEQRRNDIRNCERDSDALTMKIDFAMREAEKLVKKMTHQNHIHYTISHEEYEVFQSVLKHIEQASTLEQIKTILNSADFETCKKVFSSQQDRVAKQDFEIDIQNYRDEATQLEEQRNALTEKLRGLQAAYQDLINQKKQDEQAFVESFSQIADDERAVMQLQQRVMELMQRKNMLDMARSNVAHKQEEMNTFKEYIGAYVDLAQEINNDDAQKFTGKELGALKQQCERLCYKIEDMGGGGGGDVMHLFEETQKELDVIAGHSDDTSRAVDELQKIIADLQESLKQEFEEGLEAVNNSFKHNFVTLFSGGDARIVILKSEDEDGVSEGIDIDVALPKKNITSLAMLSGGERALTSIALLFALCSLTPPPFLVLDETDAALDEANSARFSNMLTDVSAKIPLVVITHNRETMSQAQKLFGVTIPKGGSSVVLSVVLEDALQYAK